MPDQTALNGGSTEARPPWYADKDVPVLMYRINRRPRPQGNLFDQGPTPDFLDHLAECLLFGEEVATSRGGHVRRWRLGNREINETVGYLAGWVGYRADDAEEVDDYDSETMAYVAVVIPTERRASAPFAIVARSQYLFVAKHPTFAEGSLAVVFEQLLNEGEEQRTASTTDWSVEPLLDELDFTRWLAGTMVLDSVAFHVKLPNPDAAESFAQLTAHMNAQDAGTLDHKLLPRDPEAGLNKDFRQNPISEGLLEMALRSFASVTAKGKSIAGAMRTYNQRERVRREPVRLPGSHESARQAIVQHALQRDQENHDG